MAISDNVLVTQGQTSLFSCIGWGLPSVQITWAYNEQSVMNSTALSVFEQDVVQGGRSFRHSVLRVCSVGSEDAGTYMCIASSGANSANSSTQLAVLSKSVLQYHPEKRKWLELGKRVRRRE